MFTSNVEFIKERYYKGKLCKIGDVVKMDQSDATVYLNQNAVKYHVKTAKKIPLKKKSYKELQEICKNNNLPAVGKREDLINYLNEKGIN
ncbi:MAG: SAP domain-containing protein [Ignavibacteria bacterium]|jgi:hypothetical protein